jgi:hypothetical protein
MKIILSRKGIDSGAHARARGRAGPVKINP